MAVDINYRVLVYKTAMETSAGPTVFPGLPYHFCANRVPFNVPEGSMKIFFIHGARKWAPLKKVSLCIKTPVHANSIESMSFSNSLSQTIFSVGDDHKVDVIVHKHI